MLTQQQRQAILQAQQNLSSPSASEVDSRRLRMLLNSQAIGKDGQLSLVGDVVSNVGSPMQTACPVLQRGDTDMLIKVDFTCSWYPLLWITRLFLLLIIIPCWYLRSLYFYCSKRLLLSYNKVAANNSYSSMHSQVSSHRIQIISTHKIEVQVLWALQLMVACQILFVEMIRFVKFLVIVFSFHSFLVCCYDQHFPSSSTVNVCMFVFSILLIYFSGFKKPKWAKEKAEHVIFRSRQQFRNCKHPWTFPGLSSFNTLNSYPWRCDVHAHFATQWQLIKTRDSPRRWYWNFDIFIESTGENFIFNLM